MRIRRLFSHSVLFPLALALAVASGTLTTLWVLQPPAAEAANLSVNDTSDSVVAGDSKCALREAIITPTPVPILRVAIVLPVAG